VSDSRGRGTQGLFLLTEVFANGGIQRFNKTLLAAAGECGVATRVLTLNDPAADSVPESYPNATVRGFAGDRKRFALAVTRSLWLADYDYVLVGHINLLALVVGALFLRPFSAGTVVLVAHGIEVWSGIGRLRRFSLSRARRILCVSRYTRQRILDQAPGLDPKRLTVFPNALSETWRGTIGREITRPLPDRFILSVTRLAKGDRYKGIVTVIEALSMLEDDSMHYCVIGHGNDLPFLRCVAERCGVAHRVHFLSGVGDAELITLYERCVAFVLPSGKEGFGIVFLEAMYFGAPVIAAAAKGALDVVQDGETGLLVRFGDTVALKGAIERLQADPALRDRIVERGRATVTERGPFTFSRFAKRYAEVLRLSEPDAP
jgi:glycosyltransferase involved in cell wall biosynthesis